MKMSSPPSFQNTCTHSCSDWRRKGRRRRRLERKEMKEMKERVEFYIRDKIVLFARKSSKLVYFQFELIDGPLTQ